MVFFLAHRLLVLPILVVVLGIGVSVVYYRKKQRVLREIDQILAMCRGTKCWLSKSEFKLAPSLEGLEGDLHERSLFALLRIREKMWGHYHIHLEKDGQNR
jgi:hypothetical protein